LARRALQEKPTRLDLEILMEDLGWPKVVEKIKPLLSG
jgi:hypothetical protein